MSPRPSTSTTGTPALPNAFPSPTPTARACRSTPTTTASTSSPTTARAPTRTCTPTTCSEPHGPAWFRGFPLVSSPLQRRKPLMHLIDSRRLTGPNLLLDRPGAVLEVSLLDGEEISVPIWKARVRWLLKEVGWAGEQIASRLFLGGAMLAISAPIDALYTATEINELAWESVEAMRAGTKEPDLAEAADRLRLELADEVNPELLALRDAAAAQGVSFLSDDRLASVGLGTGSLTWPVDALPAPEAVDWEAIHDVPVLLVTGTNGKTTTVRLLAAMLSETGTVPGVTSTDRIEV